MAAISQCLHNANTWRENDLPGWGEHMYIANAWRENNLPGGGGTSLGLWTHPASASSTNMLFKMYTCVDFPSGPNIPLWDSLRMGVCEAPFSLPPQLQFEWGTMLVETEENPQHIWLCCTGHSHRLWALSKCSLGMQ